MSNRQMAHLLLSDYTFCQPSALEKLSEQAAGQRAAVMSCCILLPAPPHSSSPAISSTPRSVFSCLLTVLPACPPPSLLQRRWLPSGWARGWLRGSWSSSLWGSLR
jgi:hypothetical protein